MPAAAGEAPDRGVQGERTRLAWSRTSLSFAVNGVLLLHSRDFAGHGPALRWLPGILVLACALGCHLCGARRYRNVLRAVGAGLPVTEPRLIRAMGLVAVVPGLLALTGALVG